MGDQVTAIADGDSTRATLGERISIYRNDWEDYLDKELGRQFVEETKESIKLMIDCSQNIFRRIIRETCTVYKNGIKRELLSAGAGPGSEPVENPRYDEVMAQMDLDWKMAEAHRLAKASWVSFLRPRMLMATGEMRMEIITADEAHVDLDTEDPLKMTGFGYHVHARDKKGKWTDCWVYYTEEQIRYLDMSGREIENPFSDDIDTTNPYGIIPVVPFFATAPVMGFWDLNWNYDAVRANYVIGVLNTYMNYLVKTQSFKQIVLTASAGKETLGAILDPLSPIVLPENATAATLDLNTQLGAIDQVIRGKISAIANNYGISNENFTITGDVASGFSLKVANRALEEIRAADKTVALKTEKELFDVIRIVNNTSGVEAIPEELELKWDPGEIEYPPTMQEEQARWEFEFGHGIKNQIDYLIHENPELSREDAMLQLQQIKEENVDLKPTRSPLEMMFGGTGEENVRPFQRKAVVETVEAK